MYLQVNKITIAPVTMKSLRLTAAMAVTQILKVSLSMAMITCQQIMEVRMTVTIPMNSKVQISKQLHFLETDYQYHFFRMMLHYHFLNPCASGIPPHTKMINPEKHIFLLISYFFSVFLISYSMILFYLLGLILWSYLCFLTCFDLFYFCHFDHS